MKVKVTDLLQQNKNNRELNQFINDYNINDQWLNKYFSLLDNYLTSYNLCKKREKPEKCQQIIPGYRYKLIMNNEKKPILILTDCWHKINSINNKSVYSNFLIRHYDDKLLSLSWKKDFYSDGPSRGKIVKYLNENLKNKSIGLYLHGDTRTGKTFIFILIANKLANQNKTVCFVNWPEFITELKTGFRNEEQNSNSKIEQLKKSEYLFIDDLGGEAISAWERDEVLFPVLNARVLPLKTTFINSNYDINLLKLNYEVKNNNFEKIKVKRLIERIKQLTMQIPLHVTKLAAESNDNNK